MSEQRIAEHPDEWVTASYLEGNLAGPERERFEAHLASCDLCRDGVTLLRSAEDDGAAVPPEALRRARAVSAPSGGSSRNRLLLGVAASLLIISAVAVGVLRFGSGHRPAPSPIRGNPPTFTGLFPSGNTLVSPSHVIFRWSPVEGADRYELSVFDAAGKKVAQATLDSKDVSAPWPEDAPPPTAGSYLWKIRAMALDRAVAESDPIAFEVGP